ncbi:hypothetical protein BV22DRAFT_1040675 [Leucogyrophana mollusca]|uniref:Uncharacterized protein n=1 Tax=Leucogyrophana mollusca TaxID=85980 RepID=A0ACB8B1F5_9AGAM|nr:hypothetical protein BV22DRAFT_1040675 [Leucogyrophana mollusca]
MREGRRYRRFRQFRATLNFRIGVPSIPESWNHALRNDCSEAHGKVPDNVSL